jgi:hypothetical protein
MPTDAAPPRPAQRRRSPRRTALRVVTVVVAVLVALPVGLLGLGLAVQGGQTWWQTRLENDRAHTLLARWTPSGQVPALADDPRSLRRSVDVEGWSVGADGRTLTLLFAGADGPAAESGCGADYAGRAVETSTGVVPVVRQTTPSFWTQVRRFGEVSFCPAIAVSRSVQVTLDAPLADRAVLSLRTGVPVPGRSTL